MSEVFAEAGVPSQAWSVCTPNRLSTESRVPPSWKK